MKRLRNLLASNPKFKLLDVGTGIGNFIQLLLDVSRKYGEIVGIDTSDRSIEIASNNFKDYKKIKLVKMDANSINYQDNYFDFVCLSNSLHHLDNIKNILFEMERVLKPSGMILIHEMVADELTIAQKSHKMLHHLSAEIDREFGMTHNDTFAKAEIAQVLSDNSNCEIADSWVMDFEQDFTCSKEDIEELIKILDRIVSRVKEPERVEYYIKKAEDMKKYFFKNGYAPAPQLMYVLKKR